MKKFVFFRDVRDSEHFVWLNHLPKEEMTRALLRQTRKSAEYNLGLWIMGVSGGKWGKLKCYSLMILP